MAYAIRVPRSMTKVSAVRRMKAGRRIRRGKSYVIPHRDGSISVARVGKSLRADRRMRVSGKRIPRTRSGRLKPGYGHRGDYPRRRR